MHVCQRWRNLVFRSPRRLKLRLFCTPETPARKTLNAWPALPLIIEGDLSLVPTYNVTTLLERHSRVCQVSLYRLQHWHLESISAVMQVPFPELTKLGLTLDSSAQSWPGRTISDSFLGGSAPRLQYLDLGGIPFPGLPKLLLSATQLVHLNLFNIPYSGYISPEAMTASISAFHSLKDPVLEFRSALSRPDRGSRRPPSSKRSLIPALTHFHFKGVIEYLEDLVTFIDAAQLDRLSTIFFGEINFDSPRLAQFINSTSKLNLRARHAHVAFNDWGAELVLTISNGQGSTLEIETTGKKPYPQLSSVARVSNYSLSSISTVELLCISCENLDWEKLEE